MKGAPLELLSNKHFTKHRILNAELEHPSIEGFEKGEFVWCKIDKESELSKRSASGMRMHHVWAVTENFKKVTMLNLDVAFMNLSNPIKTGKDYEKPTGEQINSLLTKVRKEAQRLIDLRKHQAAVIQNSNQAKSKSGYAVYTFNHLPLKIMNNGETLFKLDAGDKFKVKRVSADKNEMIVRKQPKEVFIIDDLRLCMLICRSSVWST